MACFIAAAMSDVVIISHRVSVLIDWLALYIEMVGCMHLGLYSIDELASSRLSVTSAREGRDV